MRWDVEGLGSSLLRGMALLCDYEQADSLGLHFPSVKWGY